MLAIPVVLGMAAGGWRSEGAWLMPVAILCVFLAHHAFVPWLQRRREGRTLPRGFAARRLVWGFAPLAVGILVFALAVELVYASARGTVLGVAYGAATLAAVYALAAIFGLGRSILAELVGMAGMSLNAAMIEAAGGRPFGRSLFGGAVLAFAYCVSSLAFVRAFERLRGSRWEAISACVMVHLAVAAGLVAAALGGVVPPWWWIAFLPVAARTVWGLARPPANLRQLGLREVWVAAAFTGLAALSLWYAIFPPTIV